MNKYTSIYWKDGVRYAGDTVRAFSIREAQRILNGSGRGHMKVDGKLVAEIPITNRELKRIVANQIKKK